MAKTRKRTIPEGALPFGYTPEKLWTYNQLIEDNWVGVWYFENRDYKEAADFYQAMLGKFFKQQATDRERYHKGLPYHNLGVALAARGRLRESAKNFVLAYIEDILSLGDGADNFMAARALHMIGIHNKLLEPVKEKALSMRPQPLDPEVVYSQFQGQFEEPALVKLDHADLLPLLSTESAQNLSSIVRIQTQTILSHMDQDRRISWIAFIIGAVSLMVDIAQVVFR